MDVPEPGLICKGISLVMDTSIILRGRAAKLLNQEIQGLGIVFGGDRHPDFSGGHEAQLSCREGTDAGKKQL
ncbi:uncharacterized protein Aud_006193 [Aspergillus udagawae]|uniref:Uncharacterized protein n=1 Tax=Aspergillus udagawae TaxID=91492 RepID=A0A8E0QW04_9EURO|nr:uncharacterized protein Aud_006193 [Aspergillus udagawae]GIC89768.1 hypothetical protein Aud_006193 [Aspergillus udagawae]